MCIGAGQNIKLSEITTRQLDNRIDVDSKYLLFIILSKHLVIIKTRLLSNSYI